MDLGVTRGTKVLLKRRAPLGDPLQIFVKGCDLAIRKAEARHIEVDGPDRQHTGSAPAKPRDDPSGPGTAG